MWLDINLVYPACSLACSFSSIVCSAAVSSLVYFMMKGSDEHGEKFGQETDGQKK